jgi:hypothetical protein
MASHKFKVEINANPGDPPQFPAKVELEKCLWCSAWFLSMVREKRDEIGITYDCPHCEIERTIKEIADLLHKRLGVQDGD